MLPQSRDTHPEAERVQIELLSKASTKRRLALGISLSQTAYSMARQAIAKANPQASEEEHKLLFVEVTYGKDLAEKVRAYLRERQR